MSRVLQALASILAWTTVTSTAAVHAAGDQRANSSTARSAHVKLHAVDPATVRWTGGFWGARLDQCARVIVPNLWRVMQLPDNAATFNDLRMAAGLTPKGKLYQRWQPDSGRGLPVKLIPYYAWANRGVSEMSVWLPVCD